MHNYRIAIIIFSKALLKVNCNVPERIKVCVSTLPNNGVTLVSHVGQNAEEFFGSLGTVLNEGRGLSILKDVMLYKQRFVPVRVCACPICICATQTHVGGRG